MSNYDRYCSKRGAESRRTNITPVFGEPIISNDNGKPRLFVGDNNTAGGVEFAPIDSPSLTGTPTSPTPSAGTNTKQIVNAEFVKTAVENATLGLLDFRGNYDASSNLFPSTGGSGISGAIMKSDTWIISVAGTLGSDVVDAGDFLIAEIDNPSIESNWSIINKNIGFTPENITNKVTQILGYSGIKYPSTFALLNYIKTAIYSRHATLVDITAEGTVTTYTEDNWHYTQVTFSNLIQVGRTYIAHPAPNVGLLKIQYSDDGVTWTPFATSGTSYWENITSAAILISKYYRFCGQALDGTALAVSEYRIDEYNLTTTSEKLVNRLSEFQTVPDDIHYPTEKLVKDNLDTKEPTITVGTSAQYYRGDKTFQTLDKDAVGLSNTDSLPEGTANFYHTDARSRQSISLDVTSESHTTYDNATGIFKVGTQIAGSDKQVQFNDNGVFAGSSDLTFNKTEKKLIVQNLQIKENPISGETLKVDVSGNVYTESLNKDYGQFDSPYDISDVLFDGGAISDRTTFLYPPTVSFGYLSSNVFENIYDLGTIAA